ncbi:hypothetical protein LLH00_15655 [bacterium]|nr:hypothetical protein [bacterium]
MRQICRRDIQEMRKSAQWRAARLAAVVLFLACLPSALPAQTDSLSVLSRRKFWAFDFKGLGGFYPASYSRVDGLLGGWGLTLTGKEEISIPAAGLKQVVEDQSRPSLGVSLLVPSARHAVGGTFSLSQTVSSRRRIKAGLELFSATASSDSWRSAQPWSGLYYFAGGRDRQYYYDRRGGRLSLGREYPGGLSLELATECSEVRSLVRRGVWTVAKSELLKDNPPVDRGGDFSLELRTSIDRTAGGPFFPQGWSAGFRVLKAARLLGGDFDYSLWRADLFWARHLLSESNYAFARLTGMTAGGRLPPHRLFSLGAEVKGLDTFEPDFNLFDRRGDRLWLLSLGCERLLPFRFPLVSRHLTDPGLELDFDTGSTRLSRPGDSSLDLFSRSLDCLESSVALGGGFSLSRVRVRLFYVHSLNDSYHGPRFDLRVGAF